jgi:hypothetical protein
MAVAAFARQVIAEIGRFVAGEMHALRAISHSMALAAVFDDETGGCRVAEPRAGGVGCPRMCASMESGGIEHGGDAALGPAGGGIFQGFLGDQRHPAAVRKA